MRNKEVVTVYKAIRNENNESVNLLLEKIRDAVRDTECSNAYIINNKDDYELLVKYAEAWFGRYESLCRGLKSDFEHVSGVYRKNLQDNSKTPNSFLGDYIEGGFSKEECECKDCGRLTGQETKYQPRRLMATLDNRTGVLSFTEEYLCLSRWSYRLLVRWVFFFLGWPLFIVTVFNHKFYLGAHTVWGEVVVVLIPSVSSVALAVWSGATGTLASLILNKRVLRKH